MRLLSWVRCETCDHEFDGYIVTDECGVRVADGTRCPECNSDDIATAETSGVSVIDD